MKCCVKVAIDTKSRKKQMLSTCHPERSEGSLSHSTTTRNVLCKRVILHFVQDDMEMEITRIRLDNLTSYEP
jgi:hypothetical protein